MAVTLVRAKCHCGSNDFFASFLTSDFPISNSICHCHSCRHVTGQTHAIYVSLAGAPLSSSSTVEDQVAADLSGLTIYGSSAKGTRYFCNTCGAHMFFKDEKGDAARWEVSAGVLEQFDGIVKIEKHIHIGDTLDGGISDHLLKVDGLDLPRYIAWAGGGQGEKAPQGWKDSVAVSKAEHAGMLHFFCHCKSIDFYLQRPTEIIDPKKQWYLVPGSKPEDPIRCLTEYCFCTSCRVTSGSIVGNWTFVKNTDVYLSPSPSKESALDLKSPDPSKRPTALKQYISSPAVRREFCGTCGATVFYWRDVDGREHMDIATGLVDEGQAGGVRAESWFKWGALTDDGNAYEEDCTSQVLVKALKEGI
ncbi:Mss4-like protein [Coprinopsis sp. MPI-PUGE-AT-0042]|nr:Mss4-like protein [Coprinopsis sp. MPI-PUGE-AT-0042]